MRMLPCCNERFWVFDAASLADLIVHAGKVPEEMAARFAVLPESGTPVRMGDHTPPPLPEALLGMQLGRVSRRRLHGQPQRGRSPSAARGGHA
jgi:hypothetical protein